MFEDEESQAFYEALPELQALVPAILLQDPSDAPAQASPGTLDSPHAATGSAATEAPQQAARKADRADKEGASHQGEDALFAQLPSCTSTQACDSFCASFCLLGRKAARKRLVRLRACWSPAQLG